MKRIVSFVVPFFILMLSYAQEQSSWIRVNLLGYLPQSDKVVVWVSKGNKKITSFQVLDSKTNEVVYTAKVKKLYGKYGPFSLGARLDITSVRRSGTYYVLTDDGTKSPLIKINQEVYKGAADYALRYMRQQRSLFNPYLKDSCHTHDGFTMYGSSVGLADSTRIDVAGGWHDASDYLQYATTSANATFHLLAAYRDFPQVFSDEKQANGLEGKNGIADILDEAKWGLDWLMKMHPKPHMLFNQIADDRDHSGYRLPGFDSLYGRGHERPVYFVDGKPQQRGKFLNNTTGTSSTAAKFSSAFSLAYQLLKDSDRLYAERLKEKAQTAYDYAYIKPGVTQTVSVKSPYIYAEDNWVDDMELAEVMMYSITKDQSNLNKGLEYARQEPITPWMIRDTANHYQYYPFINLGHYELAKAASGKQRKEVLKYYKQGIEYVWNRAKENMFLRGVPFIWCSNNLTTSFAIQTYWYKKLSADEQYAALEQANFDWLFGVNPWGSSMVYGLPADGDTPENPHSSFTYLHNLPIDGGLVDGPVYTSIYNNLIGIKLLKQDGYAPFQSDLVVYHDDFGDYSTNEPTMDGTASLIYLLSAKEAESKKKIIDNFGAVIRGNPAEKNISLVFTGDEYLDGLAHISKVLEKKKIKGAFFVTGKFQENKNAVSIIQNLAKNGHYVGPHSDQHLLYAPWENRDSLLITQEDFEKDLEANLQKLEKIGIKRGEIFIAPYEWYNKKIVDWSAESGMMVYNFTPGLRTAADYTYPEMGVKYLSSEKILNQLYAFEESKGLNGYIILIHIGADARRKDKLYLRLEELITQLQKRDYNFISLDKL